MSDKFKDVKENPGIEKSEFRKLVDFKYNGDFDRAVEDVLSKEDLATMTRLINSCDRADKKRFFEGYKKLMDRIYPGGFKTAVLEGKVAPKLRITTESVRRMKNNPYKAKVSRAALGGVLSFAGVFGAGILSQNPATPQALISLLGMGGAALTSTFSVDIGFTLVNYANFNRLKKIYSTPEYQEQYKKYLENKNHLDDLMRLVAQSSERRL